MELHIKALGNSDKRMVMGASFTLMAINTLEVGKTTSYVVGVSITRKMNMDWAL